MGERTYTILGMHCGACVRKVQAVLEPLAERVEVTLQPPQVVVEGDVPFERLNAAVKGVGRYTLKRPVVRNQEPGGQEAKGVAGGVKGWLRTYFPLLMIAGYITVGALAAGFDRATMSVDWMVFMRVFMAGFFLVFSFFKLLNLRGFVDAFAGYDLLAMRWRGYGYVYPFIELVLGVAFAFDVLPLVVNGMTVLVMGFGTVGVVKALVDKKRIRCACLGTVLNLPMTTVTVVENMTMIIMSILMIIIVI